MNTIGLAAAEQHFDIIKSVDSDGRESWSALDLMKELGYEKWDDFELVIADAKLACENSSFSVPDNFSEIRKDVVSEDGVHFLINNYQLSRYACYLIAQNADPEKTRVAYAQTYFAMQTHRQEVSDRRMEELERLAARVRLTETEKNFAGIMFDRGIDKHGLAEIKARGDSYLFGGNTTAAMKRKLGVPVYRPLADFLPTVTLRAKDLATAMTNLKTTQKDLKNKESIAITHEGHNASVRKALTDQNIFPENLPAEQDIKKLKKMLGKGNSVSSSKSLTKSNITTDQTTGKFPGEAGTKKIVLHLRPDLTKESLIILKEGISSSVGDTEIDFSIQTQNKRRLVKYNQGIAYDTAMREFLLQFGTIT